MPIYIVVSPPIWMDVDDLYAHLTSSHAALRKGTCIKEYGKDGGHPHLNWIVSDPPSYVEIMEELEGYCKTLYYPCGKRRRMNASMRRHMILYEEVYDYERLLLYLDKEPGCLLLHTDDVKPDIDWEFKWVDVQDKYLTYLYNIRNWISNYPIVKQMKIYDDYYLFDKTVRKMLMSVKGIEAVLRWNVMHVHRRDAICLTLKTELKE